MEQRGQKRPMIAQGHQRQPHCQEPVATPAQVCLNHQDRMRQRQGREGFVGTCYEPGKGALLVAEYLYALRCRAKDNNEVFWRSFAIKYFAPGAKNRICISNSRAVTPKDDRHCELCNDNLTNRLEVALLPSLFRIKYERGTLEEVWVMDRPNEYQNSYGQTVLDYENATLETVYENMRVVHEGQLRVVLTPDLKIFSWDFCVRQFEELVPKRLINTQLIQLEEAAQRYQSDSQNASSDLSAQVLQDSCNRFLTPVLELAKVMNPPIDMTFGFSKSSIRLHQVADVLAGKTMEKIMEMSNRPGTMKNLMESSKRPGASPINSLKLYRAASKLLTAKHASAPSLEGSDPPANDSKVSPTVKLPHWPGSTFTPSSSNNSPCISQQSQGSRPSSSYGTACGSKEPLLESSFQAGLATHCGPEGFGAHMQFQQPQSSSQQVHEGGTASSWFRGKGSEAGTSEAVSNVAPADQNDTIPILAAMGDHNDGFSKLFPSSSNSARVNDPDWSSRSLSSYGAASGSQEPLLKASQAGLATRSGLEESLKQFWTMSNSQPVERVPFSEQHHNGDHNPIPVSALTPSSSSYSPLVNQQASDSTRLCSSYGAASGSNAPLLEASFQAGNFRPEGFCAHVQFQQPSAGKTMSMWEPQSSSQQVHEGGTASSWFRGRGSEAGTSEAVSNVAAATSTPANQNDTIPILAGIGDHNESSHFIDGSNAEDGYNTDNELSQLAVEWGVK